MRRSDDMPFWSTTDESKKETTIIYVPCPTIRHENFKQLLNDEYTSGAWHIADCQSVIIKSFIDNNKARTVFNSEDPNFYTYFLSSQIESNTDHKFGQCLLAMEVEASKVTEDRKNLKELIQNGQQVKEILISVGGEWLHLTQDYAEHYDAYNNFKKGALNAIKACKTKLQDNYTSIKSAVEDDYPYKTLGVIVNDIFGASPRPDIITNLVDEDNALRESFNTSSLGPRT